MENDKVEDVRSNLQSIIRRQFPDATVQVKDPMDFNTKKPLSDVNVKDFQIKPNSFHTVSLDTSNHYSYDITSTMEPVKLVHKTLRGAKYDTFLDPNNNQDGFTVRGNVQELDNAIKNHQSVSARINTSPSVGISAQL